MMVRGLGLSEPAWEEEMGYSSRVRQSHCAFLLSAPVRLRAVSGSVSFFVFLVPSSLAFPFHPVRHVFRPLKNERKIISSN